MTEIERKGLQLIRSVWRACIQARDLDGSEVEDWLVQAGIIVAEPYDPTKHGPSDLLDPGDTYYVLDAEIEKALDRA